MGGRDRAETSLRQALHTIHAGIAQPQNSKPNPDWILTGDAAPSHTNMHLQLACCNQKRLLGGIFSSAYVSIQGDSNSNISERIPMSPSLILLTAIEGK